MGTSEAPAIAGAAIDKPAQQISGRIVVARILKQEGIKHICRWPRSAVN